MSGFPFASEIYSDAAGNYQVTSGMSAIDFGRVLIEDPRLKGNFGSDSENPQESRAWKYAHDAAKAFIRRPNPDRGSFQRHLDEMLAPLAPEVQVSSKILEAENRRRDLRNRAADLRNQGYHYHEILERLAPGTAVVRGIIAGAPTGFGLLENMKFFVEQYTGSNWNEIEKTAGAELHIWFEKEPYFAQQVIELIEIEKVKATCSKPETSLAEIADFFKRRNQKINQAVGAGLAANPNLEDLLKSGLGYLLKERALNALALNYAKEGKPSTFVHQFIINSEAGAQEIHSYLYELMHTGNYFPGL